MKIEIIFMHKFYNPDLLRYKYFCIAANHFYVVLEILGSSFSLNIVLFKYFHVSMWSYSNHF